MNKVILLPDAAITVPQVFRSKGVNPTNEESWAVGTRIATMYADEYGEQPPKDNRPKTNGQGSHCFALYPPSWFKRIAAVIDEVTAFRRNQGDLFV